MSPVLPTVTSGVTANHLYVVANRLPVSWSADDGWVHAPGGLVTALESLVKRRPIGWFGSAAALGSEGPLPTWSHGTLHPVAVAAELALPAVDGMANSTLWPALHGLGDRVRWRDDWWEAYVAVNDAFAEEIAQRVGPGAQVWVHDYHLLLLPEFLAARRPDVAIGLSLHTPVDGVELSRLPVAARLRSALGVPTVIGVQTENDRRQLLALLGVADDDRVLVSPVSIDPASLAAPAADRTAALLLERLGVDRRDRTLIVGVDRMDYTKGITERLVAVDRCFRSGILDPDRVEYVQIAQPSRPNVTGYREIRLEIERAAHEVASTWLRPDRSSPIRVLTESVSRRLVLAVLARADIALVTPPRDGMNLVAKEFSIANEAHAGVLVLSRGAGASAELGAASVSVDGGDPRSVAAGIEEALALDEVTRRRWASLRADIVRSWTAADWSDAFCERLAARSGLSQLPSG